MSITIEFPDLASELLSHILLSVDSVPDLLALVSTCKRLRQLYNSRKATYLAQAVSEQYGPLHDAVQLVTYNTSQPAHFNRSPPLSTALLHDIVRVGRIAAAWEDIYPSKHWQSNYEDRRLLTPAERYTLRRAFYRLWLYTAAFHNDGTRRTERMSPQKMLSRRLLLHNYGNDDLAQMADAQAVMRAVLRGNVCPSNGTIERKFRKRFPETNHQLLFNMHLNYPPPSFSGGFGFQPSPTEFLTHRGDSDSQYKYYAKYRPTAWHEPGAEGWGDDIAHYYVVEDMLKLSPGQILWLRDNAPRKCQVEAYVRNLGEWFENNGETFGQTMEIVLRERGLDVSEFLEAVEDGTLGIAGEDNCGGR